MIDNGQCVFSLQLQKRKLPQKNMRGGQHPFLKTSRWPILPHLGGLKWVTNLFLENIDHFFIPSGELQCISEKQVTQHINWAKKIFWGKKYLVM